MGFFPFEDKIIPCKLNLTDPDKMLFGRYPTPNGSFILSLNDKDDSLYMIYQRVELKEKEIGSIFGAKAVRGQEGQYVVTEKYIELASDINFSIGSSVPVRHANGRDWWIIFLDADNRQHFYAVLLDKEGFHPPVLSIVEEWHTNKDFWMDMVSISPDGTKLALTNAISDFIILNLDRCDGKLSYHHHGPVERLDPQPQEQEVFQFVEFSPNGRYLNVNTEFRIIQFDLEATDINSSSEVIAVFDTTGLTPFEKFGGFSNPIRAPNNNLYYWSGNSVPLIHRIEFPDREGQACNFTQGYIESPVNVSFYTQTFINYDIGPLPPGSCEMSSRKKTSSVTDVYAYPNPTLDRLHLSIPAGLRIQSLAMLDIHGQVVHTVYDYEDGDTVIDIGHLPAGVYLLQVNGQVACKVVKVE